MSVVIVGGHDRMVCQYKKICKEHNCKAKVFTQMPAKLGNQIGSPDLIILFTNTVSHKMVRCAVAEAERCNADVVRSHTSSKLLKRNLPGPFTFILNASGKIPDKFLEKKKTVGIRIPDNGIPIALVEALGNPMVTASVKDSREEEYTTDPSLIYERYGTLVDAVIDGGYGNHVPTTVVDCTDPDDISILREGIGNLV